MPQRPQLPRPRPLPLALTLGVVMAGCAVPSAEPLAPPSPARAEPVDRQAAAALDGRDTFALTAPTPSPTFTCSSAARTAS